MEFSLSIPCKALRPSIAKRARASWRAGELYLATMPRQIAQSLRRAIDLVVMTGAWERKQLGQVGFKPRGRSRQKNVAGFKSGRLGFHSRRFLKSWRIENRS